MAAFAYFILSYLLLRDKSNSLIGLFPAGGGGGGRGGERGVLGK